jgi:hypothetical protein
MHHISCRNKLGIVSLPVSSGSGGPSLNLSSQMLTKDQICKVAFKGEPSGLLSAFILGKVFPSSPFVYLVIYLYQCLSPFYVTVAKYKRLTNERIRLVSSQF